MVMDEVISILESLASGIDPSTGEQVQHEVFRKPDVIRALFTAASSLKLRNARQTEAAAAAGRAQPTFAGTPWNLDEDTLLCAEYDEGMPTPEIARRHQRTPGAIRSRLIKVGKIELDSIRTHERETPGPSS